MTAPWQGSPVHRWASMGLPAALRGLIERVFVYHYFYYFHCFASTATWIGMPSLDDE